MLSMKPSEQLKAAKALISTPDAWTQGVSARDINGNVCDARSQDATCWCSMGALDKGRVRWQGRLYLSKVTKNLVIFNDNHAHPEVMEMWDRAIALAEKDEP